MSDMETNPVSGAVEAAGEETPRSNASQDQAEVSLPQPQPTEANGQQQQQEPGNVTSTKRALDQVEVTNSEGDAKKQKTGDDLDEAEVGAQDENEVEEVLRIGVIKKIMSLDTEGEDLTASNDATFLMSKSVELFLKRFIELVLKNNSSIVRNEKKNIIKYVELVNTSRQHNEFKFLLDLLPDI